jgi:hypothetical protein
VTETPRKPSFCSFVRLFVCLFVCLFEAPFFCLSLSWSHQEAAFHVYYELIKSKKKQNIFIPEDSIQELLIL